MAKQQEEEEAAGFGWLPEEIIHNILSFLNRDDKIRAKCLSREWFDAFNTYPKLRFDEWIFRRKLKEKRKTKTEVTEQAEDKDSNPDDEEDGVGSQFRQEIDDTLFKYTSGGIPLPYQLELTMCLRSSQHHDDDAARLERWLKLALENGVRELEIEIGSPHPSGYVVPDCVLESESLTMLCLCNCKFPNKMIQVKKQSSLCRNIHSLVLRLMEFDFHTFSCLTAGCPSVENVTMENCEIISNPGLKIQLAAPYRNLNSLTLCFTHLNEAFFDNFASNLSHLRSMVVKGCYGFARMTIRSDSLRHLEFSPAVFYREVPVVINAPNLSSFRLQGTNPIPKTLSFKPVPSQMKAQIYASCCSCTDPNWYIRWNNILTSLRESRVSLAIHLVGYSSFKNHQLDQIFFAVSPETITLHLSNDRSHFRVVNYIIEKLNETGNECKISQFHRNKNICKEQPLNSMRLQDFGCDYCNGRKSIVFST